MKLAIIQPYIPSYRDDFFIDLKKQINFDLYSFQENYSQHRESLKCGKVSYKHLGILKFKQFRWFNPFKILLKYKTIVLCGEVSIITNWIILIFGKLLRKRIFIWGHGVSYSKKKPINYFHSLMYCLSDGAFFYTPKELRFWQMKFPKKKMTALYNTLTIEKSYFSELNKNKIENILLIKKKYGICQDKIYISCHRFTNPNRRQDLLLKIISESDPQTSGFIIIGDGYLKPDFSKFKNVYDFGSVWDDKKKTELFFISDWYLQFGAIGLSIVEAMAYAKPVITMRRKINNKQGVEFYYLKNGYNSCIINEINEFHLISKIPKSEIERLSLNALNTYSMKLQPEQMVRNFADLIKNK